MLPFLCLRTRHYRSSHFPTQIFDTTCRTVSEGEVVVVAAGGEEVIIGRGVKEVSHGVSSTSLEDGEVERHTLPYPPPPPHGMHILGRVSDSVYRDVQLTT